MAIRNFSDLLNLWTPKQLSRLLRVRYPTAASMYQRGVIGPAHWSRLIEISEARGEVITADMLIAFYNSGGRERVVVRAPPMHTAKTNVRRTKSKSQNAVSL